MINPELLAQAAEEATHVPTNDELLSIAQLAKKQQRLEREVATAEKALADLQKDLAAVAELDLPDALAAVGLSEFKLDDGYKVSVADEVYANIPSANSNNPELLERRCRAFEYLRNSGNEPLIKHEITVTTGKGEAELAKKAKTTLAEAGICFSDTEEVHWQTLRAWVREQLEKQTPGFPEATFGVHVKKVATIKAPSKHNK